jgi:hypothetical protein
MNGPSLSRFQTGFMEGHQANGAFVACGPPGFTALALINLGSQARKMSEVMLPSPTALSAPEVLTCSFMYPYSGTAFRSTDSSLLSPVRSGSRRACSWEFSFSALPSSSSHLACCHTGLKSTSTSVKSLDVSTFSHFSLSSVVTYGLYP